MSQVLQFSPLSISDRDKMAVFLREYSPYSDFNFTSLWSWNINEKTEVCYLDGGFILRMSDYLDDVVVYTYMLSKKMTSNSHLSVLKSIHDIEADPKIELLPGEYMRYSSIFNDNNFQLLEDRDQADYVYHVDNFLFYKGSHLRSKRNLFNRYNRFFGNDSIVVKRFISELSELETQRVLALAEAYAGDKEVIAIRRLIQAKFPEAELMLYMYKDTVIGFAIYEQIQDYIVIHFIHGDRLNFVGLVPFMLNRLVSDNINKGISYINYEQDLGLDVLRTAKKQYQPLKFLTKLSITSV